MKVFPFNLIKVRKQCMFFMFTFMFMFIIFMFIVSVSCSPKTFRLEEQSMEYTSQAVFDYSADILWIVDNSSTMQQYQELLMKKMDPFLEALDKSDIHFHLGLTSMDMRPGEQGGELIGSPAVLTPKTIGWKSLFKKRFLLGEQGSNNERGLDSMEAVLAQRKDFLRPESPLIIIILTDEEDFSRRQIEHYSLFLDEIKPPFKIDQSRGWQIHFFGILSQEDAGPHCILGKRLHPGYRYLSLVEASDGLALSICSAHLKFEQSLSKIKKRIVQYFTDYKLNQIPKENSFEIHINGKEIPENGKHGWLYHEEGNFIRFYGQAIPYPNDKINILFSPLEGK